MENKMPPGFRFHPTDEELVVHYLAKRSGTKFGANVIAQVDLYKHDPWDLPALAYVGEKEWYFLTPRDRKYPNGARPNRAAASGYWKATGTDKPILDTASGALVGIKKALVFYHGKPSEGVKTNWIMHEYRLPGSAKGSSSGSLRMDDWVLCRIYKKSSGAAHKPHDGPKLEIHDDPIAITNSPTFDDPIAITNSPMFEDVFDTLDPLDVDTSIDNKMHLEDSLMSKNVLPKHKLSHIQLLISSALQQPDARDRFKRGIESLLKHHNTKQSDESHSPVSIKRFRII